MSHRLAHAPERSALRRAASSARRRETAVESSSVRPGASPSQNGMVGGSPLASSTRTVPRSNSLDAIRDVAELKDVASHALDREILVDRADGHVFRLEQHLIIRIVGNRSARRQRGRSRAAPAAQDAIDRIAMDQRPTTAPAGGEALGQHPDNRIEVVPRQRAEGPAAPQQVEERVLLPVLRCNLGDDLLGEHVERLLGNREPVELAAANAVEERGALDEIVARERKEAPLGRAANGVAGAADALQEGCNRARRTELADEIDIADVDSEFERGGRHQGFQFAPFEPLLGRESAAPWPCCRDGR